MNQGVYVVVGAGPGIGLSTAERFAQEGFPVALLARSADKLKGDQARLQAQGRLVEIFPVDAGDPAGLRAALQAVEAQLGSIQVLHYNAVGVHFGSAQALTPENLEADLKVGVVGAQVAVQAVLPGLRTRGGTLLFTGGGAAFGPSVQAATLSVQKAALRNLVLSLAASLEGSPVRVGTVTVSTAVQPGSVAREIAELFWQLHKGAQTGAELLFPAPQSRVETP
ncbi:SDR family NAD(P)-dependent oxidoreductase [Deinococcus oregonensis]|uniref:SDR family NAD(P)-dependent oxidoreductase n=1 Tax=Deinococcus oregonensis TaxID=1805970 RepID=A0ABV6ASU2_9DEIO